MRKTNYHPDPIKIGRVSDNERKFRAALDKGLIAYSENGERGKMFSLATVLIEKGG